MEALVKVFVWVSLIGRALDKMGYLKVIFHISAMRRFR